MVQKSLTTLITLCIWSDAYVGLEGDGYSYLAAARKT